jgi:hypothetical protein
MAGDWIKMRVDLREDPTVFKLAEALELDELHIIGSLFCFWAWADKHAVDAHVDGATSRMVDKVAGVTGFAAVMQSVGWLVINEAGATLPNYERHSSTTAKERAMKSERQARYRLKKSTTVDAPVDAAPSTHPSTPPSTREEKRREENINTEANASSQLGLKPPELDLLPPEFENSSPGFPDCPYTELLALWQKHLPHLAQPRSWEGNRKVVMRQRWVEASRPSAYSPKGYATRADGIAWWDSFFAYITTTKLSHGFESEGRTWVPDLGWVCKQENFQKIIDGRYEQ